jgi:hypothetical protein
MDTNTNYEKLKRIGLRPPGIQCELQFFSGIRIQSEATKPGTLMEEARASCVDEG